MLMDNNLYSILQKLTLKQHLKEIITCQKIKKCFSNC